MTPKDEIALRGIGLYTTLFPRHISAFEIDKSFGRRVWGHVAIRTSTSKGEIMFIHNWLRRLGVLALAVPTAASGFAAEPSEPKPLITRLNPFANSAKPSVPATTAKPSAADVGPVVKKPILGPLSTETISSVLRDEQAAYTRRLEVCTQLRKVAFETNNDQLAIQADELERMAEITYKTRVARLGVKQNLRSNGGAEELERSLGSNMKSTPLTSGVQSPADIRPATAQLKNQFREVKP